jgi:thymidylate synthase (FAD)
MPQVSDDEAREIQKRVEALATTQEVRVLDHGYVKFIESWGSDERIIESARMSTGKGFRSWYPYEECTVPGCECWWFDGDPRPCINHEGMPSRHAKVGDAGLLKFLWDKQHTTPVEMAGMQIEVQAPIMVFREWQRHRTQSYSEASARYGLLPCFDYTPTVERMMRNAGGNKQAAAVDGSDPLTRENAEMWLRNLAQVQRNAETVYQQGLKMGVPKELARLSVTLGRYSKMRAQAVLLNWLKFLRLRYSGDAQYEIMKYAEVIRGMLQTKFPRTMELVNLPDVG